MYIIVHAVFVTDHVLYKSITLFNLMLPLYLHTSEYFLKGTFCTFTHPKAVSDQLLSHKICNQFQPEKLKASKGISTQVKGSVI